MTEREMNTAVFMLRCLQLGLRIEDLDLLDEGLITDMIVEAANDECEYATLADKEDIKRF